MSKKTKNKKKPGKSLYEDLKRITDLTEVEMSKLIGGGNAMAENIGQLEATLNACGPRSYMS